MKVKALETERKKAEEQSQQHLKEVERLQGSLALTSGELKKPSLPVLMNEEELAETKAQLKAERGKREEAEKRMKEKEEALVNLKGDVDFITSELNEKVKENKALHETARKQGSSQVMQRELDRLRDELEEKEAQLAKTTTFL